MGHTIQAAINPELLAWARRTSRIAADVAAKRIGITTERLAEWESGSRMPTVAQLRKAAEVYKRPLAVFFLPEPPKDFDAMRDFRRLPNGVDRDISPELALEIRKVLYRQNAAIELMHSLEDAIPPLDIRINTQGDREHTAARIRAQLGISLETQFGWYDSRMALNAWMSAVECRGVLVFQTERIPLDEMRGMSISETAPPVIVLNGGDSVNGRLFSLMHEFVHLLLHDNGICDLHEYGETAAIESFCNHIAGAVLVPAASLCAEPLVVQHHSETWSDEDLNWLANRYKVSAEALLRRLVLIGHASRSFYEAKREEFLALYAEQRRREREHMRESNGYPARYRMVLRCNGTRFTRLVLTAYNDRIITASELSDLLGTSLKHLSRIERAVFAASRGVF